MAFAPTIRGAITPATLAGRQQTQLQGDQAGDEATAALNARIQQLPAYQTFVQSLYKAGPTGAGVGGTKEFKDLLNTLQEMGIEIPANEAFDPSSGLVRGRSWMETHPVLSNILVTAGIAGGGIAAGAIAGGIGAAGAAGAASGASSVAPAAGTLATSTGTGMGVGMTGLAPTVAGGTGMATGGGGLASGLAAANGYVQSPIGQAVIGGVGSYLQSKGQSEQLEANRLQQGSLGAANQINAQSTQDRQNAQAAATPLGESQNFVAKNALLNAILPNMRNINSQTGLRPGAGSFLPDGGLDKGLVDSLYGSTPTLESLSTRSQQLSGINPQAPKQNLSNFGGFTADQTQPFQQANDAYQLEQQKKQDAQRKAVQDYINMGLSGKAGPLQSAIIGTGKTSSY